MLGIFMDCFMARESTDCRDNERGNLSTVARVHPYTLSVPHSEGCTLAHSYSLYLPRNESCTFVIIDPRFPSHNESCILSSTSAHFASGWGILDEPNNSEVEHFVHLPAVFWTIAMMLTLMLDHCKRSITSVGLVLTLPPVIKLKGASNGHLNPDSGGSAGGNGRQKLVSH